MRPDSNRPIPAISIIIRTMGRAQLSEALESLDVQTRKDFEVVVVDMSGGGNDPVLARFATRFPSLRVLTLAPGARPAALNAGIAEAAAPVIGILDDDNLYDPSQIEILLAGLESTDASYVYTGVRHATYSRSGAWIASRETGRPFSFDDLLTQNFIYATGSAFRKSLWERIGGYDERFEVLEDWDFLIRAAHAGTIAYLGVVCGESRKFTGIEGLSAFELETARKRRCHAGLHWKHRRLYLARPQSFGWQPVRDRGFLATLRRAWGVVHLCADFVAWFVHNRRHGARPRSQ